MSAVFVIIKKGEQIMKCPKCEVEVDFIADVKNGKIVYFCPNCGLTLQEHVYLNFLDKYNTGEDYGGIVNDGNTKPIETTNTTTHVETNTVSNPTVRTSSYRKYETQESSHFSDLKTVNIIIQVVYLLLMCVVSSYEVLGKNLSLLSLGGNGIFISVILIILSICFTTNDFSKSKMSNFFLCLLLNILSIIIMFSNMENLKVSDGLPIFFHLSWICLVISSILYGVCLAKCE